MATLVLLASSFVGQPAGAVDPMHALGPGAERTTDGHYRVTLADGRVLLTHGPDLEDDLKPNHGGGFGVGDPERAPVCASDYYQHILYGRRTGTTDRYASVKATIQASVRRMNAALNEESVEAGDRNADYKVKCDADDAIAVGSFTASGNDYTSVVNGARAAGYTASNADYTIFFDGTLSGVCGTANMAFDDRLIASNVNNSGGDYAVAYNQCWTNETPMHENGHNQGAVQQGAPYSTGTGGHCSDENDVMCYSPDGGDRNQGGTINRCTDRIHFDCGNDTYFDPETEGNEWLATHWNLGSSLNRFIQIGPKAPKPGFTMSCTNLNCGFTDISTDDGTITSWSWNFGDGQTSTEQHPSHTYAEAGTFTVSLTVTDDAAMSAGVSQTLVVPNNGDPDPTTPNLTDGTAVTDRSGPDRTWRTYKIFVPQGRSSLKVTLDGPACTLPIFCNPDLDLYVRYGQRPTTDEFACESAAISNDEICTVASPAAGYWYVGVYTFFATPAALGNVSVASYRVTADHS